MPVTNTSALAGGHMEGAAYEASVSLIFDHSEAGDGPRLHRHPYDESWVVLEGNLIFQLGDDRLSAGPGDIVIVPADAPHKFVNEGPGRASLVCIHASPTFRTEWLD
jgi:mannose-6-phosphate isomerase-like protein (cupin superfamily)